MRSRHQWPHQQQRQWPIRSPRPQCPCRQSTLPTRCSLARPCPRQRTRQRQWTPATTRCDKQSIGRPIGREGARSTSVVTHIAPFLQRAQGARTDAYYGVPPPGYYPYPPPAAAPVREEGGLPWFLWMGIGMGAMFIINKVRQQQSMHQQHVFIMTNGPQAAKQQRLRHLPAMRWLTAAAVPTWLCRSCLA